MSSTVFIRLAVPGNENGRNQHIDDQEQFVIKFMKEFKVYDEIYAKNYAEIDGERLKIKSPDGFGLSLPSFLDGISSLVCELKKRFRELSGTVILQDPALFNQRLHPSIRKQPTERILFGNILHDEFYNHFNVFFKPGFTSTHPNGPEINTIWTHFEFDKVWPVTTEFTVKEWDDNSETWVLAKYLISVEGDAIRQIIVDQRHQPLQGSCVKRIYFVMKTPVVIKKQVNPMSAPEKKSYSNRVLDLPCGHNPNLRSSEKVLTENKVFCLEFGYNTFDECTFHIILSRLRCRWNIPIECGRFFDYYRKDIPHVIEDHKKSPYITEKPCDLSDRDFSDFLNAIFPQSRSGGDRKVADRISERRFTYTYLIEALLSRGSSVKDQLLLHRDRWLKFLRIIYDHVDDDADNSFWQRHNIYFQYFLSEKKGFQLCEAALEDLLNHVDNRPRLGDLIKVFKRLCLARKESGLSNQITEEEWKEGYRKVRKVILTPTRIIFLAPETIMANRAINGADHDGTRIIRATFRDDNFQKMRYNQLRDLLEERTLNHLRDGFVIYGRGFSYLASSNSQMRDGGAYFMERWNKTQLAEYKERYPRIRFPDPSFKPKIIDYRKKLGKFSKTGSIPKAMARLGQCFTQARRCDGVEICLQDYTMIVDAVGGAGQYKFTDGVGCISARLAAKICQSISIKCLPSAYQIRFRGLKGMLAIEPSIDEIADYFLNIYRKGFMIKESIESADLEPYTFKCLFRGSQLKFHSSRGKVEEWPIEMVKWSSPTPVTLNKPFINILDQVSAMQSLKCHKRVTARIEELLSMEMVNYSKWIVNEEQCRNRLEGMPRRVHFATLERKYGFVLSAEPFFRSIVKAAIDSSMSRLLRKLQIPIPSHLGRSVFGVVDETGQLQYGQVFVRYTENVDNKSPLKDFGTTLTGKVLVTKFPSLCEGDVRMYEAVDIPELYHLKDVIVFPQTGPRSQPDEMAGSDLDGDEYAVIWDAELFFERNEPAFAYSSEKPEVPFTSSEMDHKMNLFYAEYMKQEDVGVTSTNHLHQSDQFGINSDVCNAIAVKNAMALDYSKSGVAPPPLTSEWTFNHVTGINEPPERSERRPDFAANRYNGNVSYQSSRLLGQLHRELRCVNDVLASSSAKQVPIEIDPLLVWKRWEKYAEVARVQMIRYNGQLRSIMDTFGINTEAEIFSGCYREIRNRHSEREQDDMSLYNTETIIETQMTEIYRKYREQFFAEFLEGENAYMRLTEVENSRMSDDEKDVLRRVCREPNNKMMAKAVAYYRVCYAAAQKTGDQKLSFAWIAYDILNTVRQKNMFASDDILVPRPPQFKAICNHRKTFIDDDKQECIKNGGTHKFGKFIDRLLVTSSPFAPPLLDKQEERATDIIISYVQNNLELQKCLFIIESWAKAKGLLSDNLKTPQNGLKWYHLALMVIMVGTNKLGYLIDENQRQSESSIIDFIPPSNIISQAPRNKLSTANQDPPNPRKLTDTDLDRLTLSFFHYLSTQDFRRLRNLNFKPFGLSSLFMRGEWIEYHTAATQTYFNILLNLRFDDLPISTDRILDRRSNVIEGDPFVVELPFGIKEKELLEKLRENSTCVEIQGRVDKKFVEGVERFVISCRGTIEAINQLKDFAIIKLPRYQYQQNERMAKPLAHLVYYQVMGEKYVDKKPNRPKNQKNDKGRNRRSMPERQVSMPGPIAPRRGGQYGHAFQGGPSRQTVGGAIQELSEDCF
ncbi:hypothetical protein CRE_23681 [Caenorhabditis remanei]|uniref:RNA-directed RNA polymerase n=1 Tax=Caenorhabditis remanei TaxID=31234 RepID=E3N4B0_CAERE|nr:hypothetical protein CRE_23681 [Caenorhabditis remanei]